MRNLYIIGNGFDLYHGLNTRYEQFANYLAENNQEIYGLLTAYYGLPDIRQSGSTDEEYGIWSRFEQALANLDYQRVLDDNSDYMANSGAGDFQDRDWHTYQIEMESIIKKLTSALKKEFNNFILEVDYCQDLSEKALSLKKDSLYLSFNYTETLQRFYAIGSESIHYIHNKAEHKSDTIILGHGTDPKDFQEPEETIPEGLSEGEMEQWMEDKANDYDYSYESAKQEILRYYFISFKNCQNVIIENNFFFEKLGSIESVCILGHSLSQVDIEYFKAMKASLPENTKWSVSYYSDNEKEQHLQTLTNLGISPNDIQQIRIEDLKAKNDLQYSMEL